MQPTEFSGCPSLSVSQLADFWLLPSQGQWRFIPARRTTTTTKTIGHQPRINDTGESSSSSVFSMLRKIAQAEREKHWNDDQKIWTVFHFGEKKTGSPGGVTQGQQHLVALSFPPKTSSPLFNAFGFSSSNVINRSKRDLPVLFQWCYWPH